MNPFLWLLSIVYITMPVRLEVRPPVGCIAPCRIELTIFVDPRPANRQLAIEVDGPEFHGTFRALEGDKAPKIHGFEYLLKSPGIYEVKAILFNSTKEYSRDTKTFVVR